jgi:3-dehydroquinate synthase
MAEVIKYGVIWDAELFQQLEAAERLDELDYLTPELLQNILTHSCQAKADVVSQDEKEGGIRAILNYGHTVGHAIESLTGYRLVNHGEAVAIGMVVAGKIAVKIGDILDALKSDKKVKSGKVRFVLPESIGKATITDQVSPEIVSEVVKACQERE